MKVDPEKIYSTSRSLFRYLKLKEIHAPDILLENEERILIKRIGDLNKEEMLVVTSTWEDFYKDQSIQDVIQNKQLDTDLKLFYQSQN